ncbi:MAG: beta-N-acetylhexosaminidase [Clostridia bacterium]|nr:beta-N-acetylhexosaminidase [Clostridia bacterium]
MKKEILAALLQELSWELPKNATLKQGSDGITITCDGKEATLLYQSPVDLARGLVLLKQLGTKTVYTHHERCSFQTLGVMIDCSRNAVLTVENAKHLLRLLALMGYNMVQLYTEDTYEIEGEPYFGYLRGRYTAAELRELDDYAVELGIELMPCMQTLAHLNAIFRWGAYSSTVQDCNDILLCDDEKTYALIDRMFASLAKSLRSRRIHIGMDEAHMVGLGRYLDRNGYHDRFDILAKHLARVCEIAKNHGYHPVMWSDMFFRLANHGEYYLDKGTCEIPERVFSNLPEDIGLVYWDYYHSKQESYDAMILSHQKFNREIWFAGSAWHTLGFAPNNEKTLLTTAPAIASCTQHGVPHVMTTIWGDNGSECSIYALLPSLVYTACASYHGGGEVQVPDFFAALTHMKYADFMALDHLNTLYGTINAATNLVYNDPLLGVMDVNVARAQENIQSGLAQLLPRLTAASKNERYGYVFATMRSLVLFLQLKADFGIRLRAAYQQGDKKALTDCLAECDRLVRRLDRFWSDFRAQWMRENKPHGFDVQDLRLGGLRQRIVACRKILRDYLNEKTASIPELEEELLPFTGANPRVWSTVATVNVL